mmetsp:Transcript_51404/g.133572  ORF Transcript_51404/g.133572 Transcript_51404/m.133572 type:complete len:215 (+) Transcript_51404:568-1212(+)
MVADLGHIVLGKSASVELCIRHSKGVAASEQMAGTGEAVPWTSGEWSFGGIEAEKHLEPPLTLRGVEAEGCAELARKLSHVAINRNKVGRVARKRDEATRHQRLHARLEPVRDAHFSSRSDSLVCDELNVCGCEKQLLEDVIAIAIAIVIAFAIAIAIGRVEHVARQHQSPWGGGWLIVFIAIVIHPTRRILDRRLWPVVEQIQHGGEASNSAL